MSQVLAEPGPFVAAEDEIPLSGAALAALMQGVLARPATFRFRAGGFSMSPFVRDGDVIRVSPLGRAVGLGDVVAFVNPETGRLVVHRVIARTAGMHLMRGDNGQGPPEGPVAPQAMLGRVTAIERNGRQARLGLGPERYVVAVLSRFGWLPSLTAGLARLKRFLMEKR